MTAQHHQGVGASRSERGQQPRHGEPPVFITGDVQERAHLVDGAAALRFGQRQQTARPSKSDRGIVYDTPAGGADLHGTPARIGQIDVEPTVPFRDAEMDGLNRAIMQGDTFQGSDGVGDGLSARDFLRRDVVGPLQPRRERGASQTQNLQMIGEGNNAVGGPVWGMEKRDAALQRHLDEDGGDGLFGLLLTFAPIRGGPDLGDGSLSGGGLDFSTRRVYHSISLLRF
ncbi:MAG TPA: hypothetical protein VH643_02660 [Gemmataceae bacterium]